MQVKKKYILLFFIILITSCAGLHHLKKYEGSDIKLVKKDLGEPTSIIPTSTGEIYIYEKTSELKGTEINKGQTTLDPILSPAVKKSERIIFTVTNGIIISVKKEVDYTRK
ncbi:MAG: hypothetical protein JW731_02880 [Bacteroidales bacterium]|nr:hypothetical protein [Bacteroidales bacterium]MBN2773399.1 hypothetical protein [Prolixibacteraceae bacterium]